MPLFDGLGGYDTPEQQKARKKQQAALLAEALREQMLDKQHQQQVSKKERERLERDSEAAVWQRSPAPQSQQPAVPWQTPQWQSPQWQAPQLQAPQWRAPQFQAPQSQAQQWHPSPLPPVASLWQAQPQSPSMSKWSVPPWPAVAALATPSPPAPEWTPQPQTHLQQRLAPQRPSPSYAAPLAQQPPGVPPATSAPTSFEPVRPGRKLKTPKVEIDIDAEWAEWSSKHTKFGNRREAAPSEVSERDAQHSLNGGVRAPGPGSVSQTAAPLESAASPIRATNRSPERSPPPPVVALPPALAVARVAAAPGDNLPGSKPYYAISEEFTVSLPQAVPTRAAPVISTVPVAPLTSRQPDGPPDSYRSWRSTRLEDRPVAALALRDELQRLKRSCSDQRNGLRAQADGLRAEASRLLRDPITPAVSSSSLPVSPMGYRGSRLTPAALLLSPNLTPLPAMLGTGKTSPGRPTNTNNARSSPHSVFQSEPSAAGLVGGSPLARFLAIAPQPQGRTDLSDPMLTNSGGPGIGLWGTLPDDSTLVYDVRMTNGRLLGSDDRGLIANHFRGLAQEPDARTSAGPLPPYLGSQNKRCEDSQRVSASADDVRIGDVKADDVTAATHKSFGSRAVEIGSVLPLSSIPSIVSQGGTPSVPISTDNSSDSPVALDVHRLGSIVVDTDGVHLADGCIESGAQATQMPQATQMSQAAAPCTGGHVTGMGQGQGVAPGAENIAVKDQVVLASLAAAAIPRIRSHGAETGEGAHRDAAPSAENAGAHDAKAITSLAAAAAARAVSELQTAGSDLERSADLCSLQYSATDLGTLTSAFGATLTSSRHTEMGQTLLVPASSPPSVSLASGLGESPTRTTLQRGGLFARVVNLGDALRKTSMGKHDEADAEKDGSLNEVSRPADVERKAEAASPGSAGSQGSAASESSAELPHLSNPPPNVEVQHGDVNRASNTQDVDILTSVLIPDPIVTGPTIPRLPGPGFGSAPR